MGIKEAKKEIKKINLIRRNKSIERVRAKTPKVKAVTKKENLMK